MQLIAKKNPDGTYTAVSNQPEQSIPSAQPNALKRLLNADVNIAKGIINIPRKIVDNLSKNEQELGSDIGQTLSMRLPTALGGTKGVGDTITRQYAENAKRALEQAKAEKDPARKQKLMLLAKRNANLSGNVFNQLYPVLAKSNTQIWGDAAAVGADILTAGSLAKGGASIVKTPVMGFAKGAIQGGIKGALTGAGMGAVQGTIGGMKSGEDFSGTLRQAGKQALTGGIMGGVIGGVTGGISGKMNARELQNKQDTLDYISPKLDQGASKKALHKSGQPGGAKTATDIQKKMGMIPTENIKRIAEDVEPLNLNPRAPADVNIIKINDEIGRDSNTYVRPYIKKNNKVIAKTELNKLINQIKSVKPNILDSPENTFRTENIKNNLIETLRKKAKDNVSLYETAIDWDYAIKENLGEKKLAQDAVSTTNSVVRQSRRLVRDYLTNRMPNNQAVNSHWEYEHNLYTAIDNIVDKYWKQMGSTGWQRWLTSHPAIKTTAKILPVGAVLGGGGYGLKKLFD